MATVSEVSNKSTERNKLPLHMLWEEPVALYDPHRLHSELSQRVV